MQENPNQLARINESLERDRQGDAAARGELVAHAWKHLGKLVKYLFRGDKLHRWEATDDVRQILAVRMLETLDKVKPDSPLHFLHMMDPHIRWVLLDLHKHYYGPEGMGRHHDTDKVPLEGPAREHHEISDFELPLRFVKALEGLSEEERDVFSRHSLDELPLTEIATLLGLTYGQVKRLWRSARLKMQEALADEAPGS